jgi:hypothetical protein
MKMVNVSRIVFPERPSPGVRELIITTTVTK